MPASCWADAAISCAEALVCCVEAETCSDDALDSSATVATSTMSSWTFAALAAICCTAAAIESTRALMPSTEAPMRSKASRACSTVAAPCSERSAPASTTKTAWLVSAWISWTRPAIVAAARWESLANASATPAGTPDANGVPPAGGGGFLLRGICNQNGQGGQTGGQNGQAGRFGGRGFGGQTVTAVSADSITVEGPNGPATIKLDADTMINKSSGASVSDIKKGDSVMVAGAFGPGGNTQGGAARSITILPQSAGN